MASYLLNGNGTTTHRVTMRERFNHTIAVKLRDTGITAGSLAIRARKPGSATWENVPNSPIDLANINSINYEGATSHFEFTLSGLVGGTRVEVTDTAESF